jgi:23S rRNA (guanosine2251-2'-O)-methyltransferase
MPQDLPAGRVICGRNTLREVILAQPERVVLILRSTGESSDLDLLIDAQHFEVRDVEGDVLTDLVGTSAHQSYAAVLKELPQREIKTFVSSEPDTPALLLALDAVGDPQNLGAILRAAECFGAAGVIWSRNRGPAVTPVVTKASVGASELVPSIIVSNLAETLKKLRDLGFWTVVAAASEDAAPVDTFDFPPRTVLIMGSEGEGVQSLLRERADFTVRIPLYGRLTSLNVSQATAIIAHHYARRWGGA